MGYKIRYTLSASKQFAEVQRKDPEKHRKVVKCLRKLGEDPKQSGLSSHKYTSKTGPNGEDLWESYVENNTPAAWRVFWCYGPDEQESDATPLKFITIVAITPHP